MHVMDVDLELFICLRRPKIPIKLPRNMATRISDRRPVEMCNIAFQKRYAYIFTFGCVVKYFSIVKITKIMKTLFDTIFSIPRLKWSKNPITLIKKYLN